MNNSQDLLCIHPEGTFWIEPRTKHIIDGPQFNQVHEMIDQYVHDGEVYVSLKAFGPEIGFNAKWFVPLITDEQLENELTKISQAV